MRFELGEEHQAFRKVVREFAESEIAPHSREWDEAAEFPTAAVLAMGELGLFGLPFPEEVRERAVAGRAVIVEYLLDVLGVVRVDEDQPALSGSAGRRPA